MADQCIFCSNVIFKSGLCDRHYHQYITEIDYVREKDIKKEEYNQYYHNLRFKIMKMINLDYTINCCVRLKAIAQVYYFLYKDASLVKKADYDIKKLINSKKHYIEMNKKEKENITKDKYNDFDFRKRWTADFLCEDGHYVRSVTEQAIDNWLYNHNILHAYEKRVFLPNNPDIVLISDFYIKKINTYIEFWGKYDKQYVARKKAKQEIYKDNNVKLIEITFDNTKRLEDFLYEILARYGYLFD